MKKQKNLKNMKKKQFSDVYSSDKIYLIGHRGNNFLDTGLFDMWIKWYFGYIKNSIKKKASHEKS